MTAFGGRVFKESLRLNEVLRVGPYSKVLDVLTRRGRDTRNMCTQRRDHLRTQREGSIYKPRERP